jgi:hypothetical protein
MVLLDREHRGQADQAAVVEEDPDDESPSPTSSLPQRMRNSGRANARLAWNAAVATSEGRVPELL